MAITNVGYDLALQMLGCGTVRSGAFTYSAIGSGATAASTANTTLGSLADIMLGTYAHTDGQKTLTNVATFPAGSGTGAITEAGLFSGAGTTPMLCRQTFSVINKGASDSLQITWTIGSQ